MFCAISVIMQLLPHRERISVNVHYRFTLVTGIDQSVRFLFSNGHGYHHITDGHHIPVACVVIVLGGITQICVFKRQLRSSVYILNNLVVSDRKSVV